MTDEEFLLKLSELFHELIMTKQPQRDLLEAKAAAVSMAQNVINMVNLSK